MDDRKRIWAFVALTFACSVPFWALGYALRTQLLPGLPISALMIVAPLLSAYALTLTVGGRPAALALLARAFDMRVAGWRSIVLAIAIMPALTAAAWLWMRARGVEMPEPELTVLGLTTLFGAFLPAAMAEELGWSGFLAGPASRQWGVLGASVVIGLIWAAWHVPPLLQAGRSFEWIAWWTLATVSARTITMAVFECSNGSVATVSILHAAQNTAWQSFPVHGSHFDPQFAGPVFAAGALAIVALLRAPAHRQ